MQAAKSRINLQQPEILTLLVLPLLNCYILDLNLKPHTCYACQSTKSHTIPPKSSRLDYITTLLIKSCSSLFVDLISGLANVSFTQGCFPTKFNSAIVKPLFKKPGSDVNSPSNYRPISNLNNISKIFEQLFLSRLNSHLIISPYFNQLQSAYRKMRSCETLNDIYLSADSGKCAY